MKKVKTVLSITVLCLSFMFTGSLAARAAEPSATPSVQIVPKTKHYSKVAYKKGRWVTVTTWHHGKKITKRVWQTTKRWSRKVAGKTHDVVMGKKKEDTVAGRMS